MSNMSEDGDSMLEDSEPMFGTLDYILLAAIGAAGIWWFFLRSKEEKVPEYNIKPVTINRQQSVASEKGKWNKLYLVSCDNGFV